MAQKRRTKKFQPSASKGLDIESVISAPLIAAATANSMMAKEQTKFLMDFCFAKDENTDNYHPVMINLVLSRSIVEPPKETGGEQKIRQVHMTFNLPVLTIIPINSLAVESVSVDFEMEVTQHVQEEETTKTASSSSDIFNRNLAPRSKLQAKISYDSKERSSAQASGQKQYSSDNKSSLKVSVKAGQLPIPGGVSTILDLYQKSIHPLPEPDPENDSLAHTPAQE